MHSFTLFLILFSVLSSSWAIECQTCDMDACQDHTRWVIETCPPQTMLCYRFTTSYGKVFRRGCANYDCNRISGLPQGSTCNTCDSDRCNGFVPSRGSHGTGDVWKGSASLMSAVTVTYILFIMSM